MRRALPRPPESWQGRQTTPPYPVRSAASSKGCLMPAPSTSDEFLSLVRKSEVVEEKRLCAYLEKTRAAGGLPEQPGKLAGLLVRDGILTQFQAEQFLQGRWKRF